MEEITKIEKGDAKSRPDELGKFSITITEKKDGTYITESIGSQIPIRVVLDTLYGIIRKITN